MINVTKNNNMVHQALQSKKNELILLKDKTKQLKVFFFFLYVAIAAK